MLIPKHKTIIKMATNYNKNYLSKTDLARLMANLRILPSNLINNIKKHMVVSLMLALEPPW